jgi:hypothetical protein
MKLLLLLFTLNSPTDSVKHDKWIFWLNPTARIQTYHPSIDVGVEYNKRGHLAYTAKFGIDLGNTWSKPYTDQRHQYVKLGVKNYKGKAMRGYIMGELLLGHLSHYHSYHERSEPLRIHEFLGKPSLAVGIKIGKGPVYLDPFIGLGIQTGFRSQKVDYEYVPRNTKTFFGMFSPAIPIKEGAGVKSMQVQPFLNLGIQIGFRS